MGKRSFTRLEVQDILESNELNCPVYYREKQDNISHDNFIVYQRLSVNDRYADDVLHLSSTLIQITFFHKSKLVSIENLIKKAFNVSPTVFSVEQPKMSTVYSPNDYMGDYYQFEIFTLGEW